MEETNVPVVSLPGSDIWEMGYAWGQELETAFPGQDADEFASACAHNDPGPAKELQILGLVMLQKGANEEGDWKWRVTLADGSTWIATGGCDYTGWDCQSNLEWAQADASQGAS